MRGFFMHLCVIYFISYIFWASTDTNIRVRCFVYFYTEFTRNGVKSIEDI